MTETNDTFECVLRSDVPLSEAMKKWPDNCRKASDAAVARLLAMHPDANVVEDTSICMTKDHPRFTDGGNPKFPYEYALVRTIKLDRPVAI